jgi:hypothetical protein
MENEYEIADQYGNYRFPDIDIIAGSRYRSQIGMLPGEMGNRNYVSYDIETDVSQAMLALERLRRGHSTASITDLASLMAGYSEGRKEKINVKPDCILDDILTKQKRGLKPYYQEKLDYKINGSNDGEYIEYEPGIDLAPTQKIEWLPPKTIEKINSCYQSRKQAFKDKEEADQKYLTTLVEIDQAIENYKTKGHNFIL